MSHYTSTSLRLASFFLTSLSPWLPTELSKWNRRLFWLGLVNGVVGRLKRREACDSCCPPPPRQHVTLQLSNTMRQQPQRDVSMAGYVLQSMHKMSAFRESQHTSSLMAFLPVSQAKTHPDPALHCFPQGVTCHHLRPVPGVSWRSVMSQTNGYNCTAKIHLTLQQHRSNAAFQPDLTVESKMFREKGLVQHFWQIWLFP